MEMSKPASVPISSVILLGTVVPGTILATVGSFLTWYESEFDSSVNGTESGGVGVATLATACLLATAAFIALRGRPSWLLGLVFVLALIPAAEAGNSVAVIEQNDYVATRTGLYLVLAGLVAATAGSIASFFAQVAEPAADVHAGEAVALREEDSPMSSQPGEPHES